MPSAGDGLVLDVRVPPGIGEDDMVARGDVQTNAPGFEAHEDDTLQRVGGDALEGGVTSYGAHSPVV